MDTAISSNTSTPQQNTPSMSEKDKIPQPPNGSSNLSNQRQDSISMYTNFNQPRLSTDSSISSFLNIDSQVDRHMSQMQLQNNQQSSNLHQSSSQNVEVPYGRGYSIISNFWQNNSANESNNSGGSVPFTTTRRQSEQLEPFMPRFKVPSFSQVKPNIQIQQQFSSTPSQNISNTSRNDNISFSKRNSIFFGTSETPELDFFNPGKRDLSMKPPIMKPNHQSLVIGNGCVNSHSNIHMTSPINTSNVPSSANINNSGRSITPTNADDIDALFNASISRKNSMKFMPEDFSDFQFRRRDSSVRATLDSHNYIPGPPPLDRRQDQSVSPIDKSLDGDDDLDDDVERRLHKHLSPLMDANRKRLNDSNSSNDIMEKVDHQKKKKRMSRKHQDQNGPILLDTNNDNVTDNSVANDSKPLLGATKVDQLMLVIQARKNGVTDKVPRSADGSLLLEDAPSILPPASQLVGGVEKPKARGIKQHECPYCHKCFTQSTHLEVHVRSHIGYKPFECEYCGKKFTQGGNLRTHVRLHTGERPYECEKCGKRFSRKGNLAAHMLTHESRKPFQCKLDECNKSFTQLGNMKAHQNRFHLQTLNRLTNRLAEMDPNEHIREKERDLLEYFASLYKNSNRGIKGRGKGNMKIVPSLEKAGNENEDDSMGDKSGLLRHTQDPAVVAAKALGSFKPEHQLKNQQLSYNLNISSNKDNDTNEFTFHQNIGDSHHSSTFSNGGSSVLPSSMKNGEVQFNEVNYNR